MMAASDGGGMRLQPFKALAQARTIELRCGFKWLRLQPFKALAQARTIELRCGFKWLMSAPVHEERSHQVGWSLNLEGLPLSFLDPAGQKGNSIPVFFKNVAFSFSELVWPTTKNKTV
jgi:hypothetical protein